MKSGKYLPALLIIPLLMASVAAAPQINIVNRLFVVPGGVSSGTCYDWAHACDLQFALFHASGDVGDDEVWVEQGTYKPTTTTDRTISFDLQNGVSLYGGFAGTETALSQRNPNLYESTLSGDIGKGGDNSDNSYHVLVGSGTDSTAVLDGFTVVEGNANGVYPDCNGGGMLNDTGNPTLRNVTFWLNQSGNYGGGMFNLNGSPALSNVTFSENRSFTLGGGMANSNGSVTLTNVNFVGNAGGIEGGGMTNLGGSATLTNVTFNTNWASNGGGMFNGGSSPKVTNVTFTGNAGGSSGGGMYNGGGSSPKLTNVTFSGNSAGDGGGGMYNSGSSPTLFNVTFSGNSAYSGGGGMGNVASSNPTVNDTIFWGDGTEVVNNSSSGTLTDVILAGGTCPSGAICAGVINGDPELGSLQNNGGFTKTLALGAGSAAIDAGGVHVACASTDQRGVTRPQGGKCDMGAYEVRAKTFASMGANDGWVLESGENTSVGGSMNNSATTLKVGDDSSNRQYRSVLSFDTTSLPDTAAIVRTRVRVRRAGLIGTNPFTTHGTLALDLKKPFFGSVSGLELGDFQASATTTPAGSIGSALISGWYAGLLNNAGLASVNKTGRTQLRLRFTLDDNNDHGADYLSLYSGNATAAYRPVMLVYYNP